MALDVSHSPSLCHEFQQIAFYSVSSPPPDECTTDNRLSPEPLLISSALSELSSPVLSDASEQTFSFPTHFRYCLLVVYTTRFLHHQLPFRFPRFYFLGFRGGLCGFGNFLLGRIVCDGCAPRQQLRIRTCISH